MNRAKGLLLATLLLSLSTAVRSEIALQVKIDQTVGAKKIETVRKVSANYNQDIEISQDGLNNKIVLSLRKFKDILVNGNKINPVQIDMKIVNEMKKIVGKPQTITSFYNKSAEFTAGDLNVSLNFEEI